MLDSLANGPLATAAHLATTAALCVLRIPRHSLPAIVVVAALPNSKFHRGAFSSPRWSDQSRALSPASNCGVGWAIEETASGGQQRSLLPLMGSGLTNLEPVAAVELLSHHCAWPPRCLEFSRALTVLQLLGGCTVGLWSTDHECHHQSPPPSRCWQVCPTVVSMVTAPAVELLTLLLWELKAVAVVQAPDGWRAFASPVVAGGERLESFGKEYSFALLFLDSIQLQDSLVEKLISILTPTRASARGQSGGLLAGRLSILARAPTCFTR